jgi:hypothetical protein
MHLPIASDNFASVVHDLKPGFIAKKNQRKIKVDSLV